MSDIQYRVRAKYCFTSYDWDMGHATGYIIVSVGRVVCIKTLKNKEDICYIKVKFK